MYLRSMESLENCRLGAKTSRAVGVTTVLDFTVITKLCKAIEPEREIPY